MVMIDEVVAIFIVIMFVAIIFSVRLRSEYAKTAYSLAILPGFYILSYFVAFKFEFLRRYINFSMEKNVIMLCGVICGLVVSCILLGFFIRKVKKKRSKIIYAVMNGLFVSVLTFVMISRLYY